MRLEYVEAVLELAAMVPAGTVLAYGDVAELLGAAGPRQVGSVLSHHGSTVPWWRILKSSGDAPPGHERQALALYLAEGTPLLGRYADFQGTGEGRWRVDIMAARWAPAEPDFERIDAIADRLERRLHRLSYPDDEMSV